LVAHITQDSVADHLWNLLSFTWLLQNWILSLIHIFSPSLRAHHSSFIDRPILASPFTKDSSLSPLDPSVVFFFFLDEGPLSHLTLDLIIGFDPFDVMVPAYGSGFRKLIHLLSLL